MSRKKYTNKKKKTDPNDEPYVVFEGQKMFGFSDDDVFSFSRPEDEQPKEFTEAEKMIQEIHQEFENQGALTIEVKAAYDGTIALIPSLKRDIITNLFQNALAVFPYRTDLKYSLELYDDPEVHDPDDDHEYSYNYYCGKLLVEKVG